MTDIQCVKPLEEEEMTALLCEYAQNPSTKIRNILVEQNLKLVFKVASMYRRSGIPFDDLVAEGNLGLIRGIEKYDLSKGVKLGYYLFKWIRAMILKHIVNNAHLVKIGTTQAQRKLFFNHAKIKAKARAMGRDITDEEIAEMLEVKPSEVQEMDQRMSAPIIRIDGEPNVNGIQNNAASRRVMQHLDSSDDVERPDTALERAEGAKQLYEAVDKFMSNLNETQRSVFKARSLKEDGEPDTFETIGAVNGLTKQRVQQIDAELKNKFKKFVSHNQISL